jgi:hypothetical protein
MMKAPTRGLKALAPGPSAAAITRISPRPYDDRVRDFSNHRRCFREIVAAMRRAGISKKTWSIKQLIQDDPRTDSINTLTRVA